MNGSDEVGDWLSDGCVAEGWNATVTVCRCCHLSVFTILLDNNHYNNNNNNKLQVRYQLISRIKFIRK